MENDLLTEDIVAKPPPPRPEPILAATSSDTVELAYLVGAAAIKGVSLQHTDDFRVPRCEIRVPGVETPKQAIEAWRGLDGERRGQALRRGPCLWPLPLPLRISARSRCAGRLLPARY